MAEVLTKAEIIERYPDSWVLVGDPVTDEHLEVLAGEVLCHSHDREEMHRQMLALSPRPKRLASVFTGDVLPADMEALL